MIWVGEHYAGILVVSGLLTLTMLQFALAPSRSQHSTFGEALEGPLANVIVRGWGLLIALIGGGLIWAAFHPETRTLAVAFAVISKAFFIGSLIAQGRRYLKGFARIAILIDAVVIALLVTGLWAGHQS
ncbi:hypothetical protein [Caulobacter vibrioides]|uniref:Uncharacterized protein n=1 Tax=Caulobacter vibrioides (strain NA1000 / CB15N) TaxID=565050 RepID=A0A0H3C551_CAUVN|nr:hypothetical protein [Caulobacter vibrioides]YP_002515421.1 hypothetical protein CCNA_00046 [Caulobacter vibrioides NA1000]ACL93513.1 hypothetical protein CCNA_00046 [Caulobacter vibrioides NA1000]ATC26884.1 hypothetical protein CA607_00235 [Caulobacter vibrioides]QXZ52143.1 hypothetical protein KZH45_00240 [Caulobacter vibrioides]